MLTFKKELPHNDETVEIMYYTDKGRNLLNIVIEGIDHRGDELGWMREWDVSREELTTLRDLFDAMLQHYEDCPYEPSPEELEWRNRPPLSDEELAEIRGRTREFIGLDALLVPNSLPRDYIAPPPLHDQTPVDLEALRDSFIKMFSKIHLSFDSHV